MPFTKTDIPGLLIFEPKVFDDERGYFFETYNENVFKTDCTDRVICTFISFSNCAVD